MAELITPDAAATAFGIGAGYMFWRWLKVPTWERAAFAGLLLGLAELSKMSWLFLFGLWPLLWIFWRLTSGEERWSWMAWRKQGLQMGAILLCGLYLLNLGYLFDGTFTPLKVFTFVSETLAGEEDAGEGGNRFAGIWLGELPIPLPEQYVLGFDTQKRDFEDYHKPSYLHGKWKNGGWWYYYLYGCLVKVPHGTQLLFLLAFVLAISTVRAGYWRDDVILLIPAVFLFVLVSSQLEFNHHFRYVLPSIGLALVFLAKPAWWFTGRMRTARLAAPLAAITVLALCGTAVSSVKVYPHSLAYFNEGAGGPENGWRHMLGSNLDWGQDFLFLKDWLDSHSISSPIECECQGRFHSNLASLYGRFTESDSIHSSNHADRDVMRRNIYVISATYMTRKESRVSDRTMHRRLLHSSLIQRVGYSLFVYRIDQAAQ